ncbi:phage baseplate assembly protein V [Modestobacter excelsi]|uniref:phage baseplate assembly protein V n=1 Tax=Modestobacter excelsi TaxID=2213161 RepID=UPI00110CAF90|nr:phage baseplate assembly protein V [Modestobacter excelsi]
MSSATARSRSTDKRYYGVVEAIVQQSAGDDEGRVKVTFPWFDGGTVTDWCRVCQLYAGDGYGATFVPERGDEVLVAFVHGDMRFPIVVGGLYNGKDKPPAAPVDGKDQKTIRTKAGHQLTFDDQSSQAAVRVRSAAGHTVELDDQGKKVRLASTGGHTVELDDQGGTVRVAAAGGSSVVVDSSGITLQTSGNITLQAGGTVTISGASISLSAANVALGQGIPVSQPVLLAGFLTHTHPSAAGPTGPAIPLPAPAPTASQVVAS